MIVWIEERDASGHHDEGEEEGQPSKDRVHSQVRFNVVRITRIDCTKKWLSHEDKEGQKKPQPRVKMRKVIERSVINHGDERNDRTQCSACVPHQLNVQMKLVPIP